MQKVKLIELLFISTIQAMNEFNGVEIVEENTLDFSEPYKDWEPSAVEDIYAEWTPKLDSKSDDAVCTRNDENVDLDYKQINQYVLEKRNEKKQL